MYEKLKSGLRKQNDIYEYQRQRKVQHELEQYKQDISYSDTKFFANCQEMLKNIASDANHQLKVLDHKRKIKKLQQSQIVQPPMNQTLLTNILIDYFRSHQMNYSYSMIMRQKNITSDEIVVKSQLASYLDLTEIYEKDTRFNVSILELLVVKIKGLEKIINTKKQKSSQIAVQCELLHNNSQHNNILLTELKLQQIRKEVQAREKKHYENQIHLFKSHELIRLKQDMTKIAQAKQAKMVKIYEQKLKQLIAKNTAPQIGQNHSQKLQQYLHQIQTLRSELRSHQLANGKLQKINLQHDCFKNQKVKSELQRVAHERKMLNQKKYEFQVALRNMDTKIEDLALQKQKIMSDGKKQTEEFLSKVKNHKQSKDFMIEKVYGTLRGFELRIQNLSKDNTKLLQDNQSLKKQLNRLKQSEESFRKQQTKQKINLSELKVPTKNASIGVTSQDISQHLGLQNNKSMAQSVNSDMTQTTEQFQQKMQIKAEHSQKINRLKLQMSLLKNKARFLVMDF